MNEKMVDRFLSWPLPASVCSDPCVTDRNYPHSRCGTNLLTADEARQMLEYLGAPELLEALEHLCAVVPEPELVSMGYDSPPEHRTQEEHEIGYALHLARAALKKATGA